MRAQALAVLVALLAGCLSPGRDIPAPDPEIPSPEAPASFLALCQGALLFQFVPHSETDPYLPPGFHPRDPQDFLTFLPVAIGQAGVILLVLSCADDAGQKMEVSSLGIFVEPPAVPDLESSLFDFYEVARHSGADPFAGILDQAGWPAPAATIEVTQAIRDQEVPESPFVSVTVSDDDGALQQFAGAVPTPVDVGTGVVRFWHDGPRGLAYLEVEAHLDSRVGGGLCNVRSGTLAAMFLGGTTCPPAEPILASFPDLTINATARFLPGVHPG